MKPASSSLAALLWAIHARLAQIPSPPAPGLTSFALDKNNGVPLEFLSAASFRVLAGRAVRYDIVERIEETLAASFAKNAPADEALGAVLSLLGCNKDEAMMAAAGLGWQIRTQKAKDGESETERPLWQRAKIKSAPKAKTAQKRKIQPRPDSPFAALAGMFARD